MFRSIDSTKRVLFASILLSVWACVNGLEAHHQFRHLVEGCNHKHHCMKHAEPHTGSKDWAGPHTGDHWVDCTSACALCDWDFSPIQSASLRHEEITKIEFKVCLVLGYLCQGFWGADGQTNWSERGPPATI